MRVGGQARCTARPGTGFAMAVQGCWLGLIGENGVRKEFGRLGAAKRERRSAG
jgi:hypothetical protein